MTNLQRTILEYVASKSSVSTQALLESFPMDLEVFIAEVEGMVDDAGRRLLFFTEGKKSVIAAGSAKAYLKKALS